MPAALADIVQSFASVPDTKLRYQQLLFFARELPPMDAALKTPENLVSGCQSVVHVDVAIDHAGRVGLQADSDAQLTKGLVALIVRGFTGAQPAEVLATDDDFLAASGLAVALTPARNNGFANALGLVKQKLRALVEGEGEESPTHAAILRKLAALEPTAIDVLNKGARHATHSARKASKRETHFDVSIVSEMFEGMTLVKRHRMIYKLLEEEFVPGKIHALTVKASTPAENAR